MSNGGIQAGQETNRATESPTPRGKSFPRRAVIQAGWSVPLIVTLSAAAPALGYVCSPFGDRPFSDNPPRRRRRSVRRRR